MGTGCGAAPWTPGPQLGVWDKPILAARRGSERPALTLSVGLCWTEGCSLLPMWVDSPPLGSNLCWLPVVALGGGASPRGCSSEQSLQPHLWDSVL